MPRKGRKTNESISALQRRSSRVTIPTPPTSTSAPVPTSASASPGPSPSTIIPVSVPVANAKNIDDINWRHPAELELIHPTASSQADIIPILLKQAFSIPPHPTDPNEKFCTITLGLGLDAERVQVVVPLGYRIPLLFCGKYLWESVRLVLTSDEPPPEKEWEAYKFDLLNLSRLCYAFLESALVTLRRKGKGMNKGWRSKTFDRVLTRYWWGWMVNREEFIRAFWMEFKEEEYERDVCRRDRKTMVLSGHNDFYLTPSEITHGITAEQFTAGLLSVPPQPSSSQGITYKWDSTLYALANELVITGSRVRERQDDNEEIQEGDWEEEEGRSRKRMKIDEDPADAEEVAFDLIHYAADGDGDVEMQDKVVFGEVLPTPPTTSHLQPGSPQFPTSNIRESTGDESLSDIAPALALPAIDSEPSGSNAASPRPTVVASATLSSKTIPALAHVGAVAPAVTASLFAWTETTRTNEDLDNPTSNISDEPHSAPLDNRAENILAVEGSMSSTTPGSAPIAGSIVASTTDDLVRHSTSSLGLAFVPAKYNAAQPSSSSYTPNSLPSDFPRSNPEVIKQVLDIVPGMLSQLRTIMEAAHSEKTLVSSNTENVEKQEAWEKMQSTTAALGSSSSSSSASIELMNSLVERIRALESDVQSSRERRAMDSNERDRMHKRIEELEGRVKRYEEISSNPTSRSASRGGVAGSNGMESGRNCVPERYRTPVSRTSSVDDSCPLPVKSKRKHMNLMAMTDS